MHVLLQVASCAIGSALSFRVLLQHSSRCAGHNSSTHFALVCRDTCRACWLAWLSLMSFIAHFVALLFVELPSQRSQAFIAPIHCSLASVMAAAASLSPPYSSASFDFAESLSVVLFHSGNDIYDPNPVKVDSCDSLLLSLPYTLLKLNTKLLQPLFQAPPSASEDGLVFHVGEFSLVLLHILHELHEQLLMREQANLTVSILSVDGFKLLAKESEMQTDSTALVSTKTAAASSRASKHSPGHPLLFSAAEKPRESRLLLCWCNTWREATAAPSPRVIYLPSLMWLTSHATRVQQQTLVRQMLTPLKATMWPPLEWDDKLENKDVVYSKFNKWMLPTRWIELTAADNDLQLLSQRLLMFCETDGDYFVKGSYSYAAKCAERIVVINGQCKKLAAILQRFVHSDFQHCVGIQPFVPGFDDLELRTWLVADSTSRKWRSALTLKTEVRLETGVFTASLFAPLHGPGLAVARLVDEMLDTNKQFFAEVMALGVPALRVDCGYHGGTEKAFFSEFSPAGNACMWTAVHHQDLAFVVGRAAGQQVWKRIHGDVA